MSSTTERIRLLEEKVDRDLIKTRERLIALREFCDVSLVAIHELDQKIDELRTTFNAHTHLTRL